MNTGTKDVTGLELLIQSGGVSSDDSATGGNFGAKRNKFFTQDFYLDDIQFESYVAGTAVGGPQNTFDLKFTVTEPMGLTFMERLYNASTDYADRLGYKDFNPVNQFYLMVVRFYGYDKDGKQIINGKFDDGSDPNSYIEKWIPIMIRQIQFRVETSKVVYACECVCPQTQAAFGQVHGTIPFNMALQGGNVGELLDGKEKHKAKGVVSSGLMDALNKHQLTLYKDGKYKIADEYAIEFEDASGIKEATVASKGTQVVPRSAMPGGATAQEVSKKSNGTAQSINDKQTFATNAGMKIAKFIDLAIRTSTYISSQYKKVNDANKDGTTNFKKKNDEPLKWFKVRPRVEIKGFDSVRQAWAYKITYVISRYDVRTVDTRDFNSLDCFETHKEYDYWFTGKNTEVLDFKQEYNSFYYTTFSSKHKENPSEAPAQQTNLRAMSFYKPNSTESSQGGENLTAEQAANAASVLYAPQDIANVEIDILGDPDWLSQSEVFYAAKKEVNRGPTLADGSINYDTAEVFFAVNFNTVVDYNLNTGVADVTQKNFNRDLTANEGGVSQYSFVYRANTITTQLAAGRFVQQLKGTLVFIPEKCVTGKDPSKDARKKENTEPPAPLKTNGLRLANNNKGNING